MYARVVIDAVIGADDKVFDYVIPQPADGGGDALSLVPGMRVIVPFGAKNVEGFVLEVTDRTDVPADKLKSVTKVLDEFVSVKKEFLAILDEICYTFKLRKIDVLRLFVPSPLRGRKRRRIPKNKEIRAANIKTKSIVLTKPQQAAADEILSKPGTYVLHGVTGSGKTEVYMNVIERVLSQGKTAIMLVPEIGLTPQVLANFRARFGNRVAILHSGLSSGARYDEWLRLHESGRLTASADGAPDAGACASIAVGARSAVFAPLENVGVIIIDEEHDASYSSESNPRFHTHEIAEMRCEYNNCPLVLGSATPSIETYHKTVTGEYKLLKLENRVNNLQMPKVEVVDMVAELRAGNSGIFSRVFLDKLTECIDAGKQAIVFLNRRGFSSFVMCRNCGWVAKCENCDVSLVYHREDEQLKCHYCGGRFTPVTRCPECSSTHLKHGATGTQRVADELEKMYGSQSKIFRMDADSVKSKDSLIDILDEFAKTPKAILVGTQMVAKGHHFPDVTLVGIIDADNSLHFSDYRAAERTFALITQVAGRAGRDGATGQVILQTYLPSHYVYKLAANYDYLKFFEKEINTRTVTKYPPFTTVLRVLVTGERDDQIKAYLQTIMAKIRERQKEFIYLAAMKSPHGRIQNKFRYQILARYSRDNREILDFVDGIVRANQPKNCQVFLEINPQSLS